MNWQSAAISFENGSHIEMLFSQQKKRVLFVLKLPPPYGGGEIAQQYIYHVLKKEHHFLLFRRKSHSKARQGRLSPANLLFGLAMIVRVLAACVVRRPKVVFIWLPKDLPAFMRTVFLSSILRLFGIKVIGDLHGMGFDFLQRRAQKWYYRRSINVFSAIRVLSPKIGERIRDSGFHNKIVPIDNGILAPRYMKVRTSLFEQPLRLLYLGAISESKGFLRVLDLLKALRRLNVRFSLNVVGEWTTQQFHQHARQVIRDYQLEYSISFLGVKVENEKWKILWKSHLLLHFSDWDGQPLTIIEAMAAGVPTIATPVGAIDEMIEHNVDGFLIDRVDQAVHIIMEMLAGRIEYDAISTSARQTFERRFMLEKYIHNIDKLVRVYDHATSDSVSENR
ncbi:glycosyltransferase family 4 protein [candidate division KSB1 bacterium]|nr:glycosyltransferase family 4 protein [candidate division KSB1 bacterium]